MTLDDRLHKSIVTDELVEYTDGGVDYSKAKLAILSDLTDIISFAEDRAEAIEKVKKYCE